MASTCHGTSYEHGQCFEAKLQGDESWHVLREWTKYHPTISADRNLIHSAFDPSKYVAVDASFLHAFDPTHAKVVAFREKRCCQRFESRLANRVSGKPERQRLGQCPDCCRTYSGAQLPRVALEELTAQGPGGAVSSIARSPESSNITDLDQHYRKCKKKWKNEKSEFQSLGGSLGSCQYVARWGTL